MGRAHDLASIKVCHKGPRQAIPWNPCGNTGRLWCVGTGGVRLDVGQLRVFAKRIEPVHQPLYIPDELVPAYATRVACLRQVLNEALLAKLMVAEASIGKERAGKFIRRSAQVRPDCRRSFGRRPSAKPEDRHP